MAFKRLTELLDKAAKDFPDKTGFADQYGQMTYAKMRARSLQVAKAILREFDEDPEELQNKEPSPVAVLMDGEINITAAMHGILYAGDYYSVLDMDMPKERMDKIMQSLKPRLLITDRKLKEKAESLELSGKILVYEDIPESDSDEIQVPPIICDDISQAPASITFTSGSTGTPKGVITGHNGILYPAGICGRHLKVGLSDRIGNQPRLYYALGELILFISIASESTCFFMPGGLFSQPAELVKYMVDNKLTILLWPTSGLTMFSRFSVWEGYEEELNENLKTISFAGDVMSTKLLNKMRKALPSPTYTQMYGATEFYPSVGYYIERPLADDERVPIGFPLETTSAYIIREDGTEVSDGERGQLCMAGPGIGIGYLNDEEETKAKFRQGIFKPGELVYMTGDIVKRNEYGELVFLSRKDFMIKHMGYRVELGEIELAATSFDDQMQCACVYDRKKEHIILVYAGRVEPKELRASLREKLPRHMVPNRVIKLDSIPLSKTNKIDRKKLEELYI